MKKTLQLLLVEDSEDDAKLVIRELTRGGYEVTAKRVETADELNTALETARWDAVISDYSLPGYSGEAALRTVRESGRDIPFIFVSGTMGEDIAVGAMKAGAHDYVMKNNLKRLAVAMDREMRDAVERQQHRAAEKQMRMSEHKYRHLFRSMSDAALLISVETDRVIDVNEQAEILFGRTRDELLGSTGVQLYAATQESPWPEPPLTGGTRLAAEAESFVRRLNGSTLPVHVAISRIQLYDRPFKLALFRDISERKRSETAMRNVLRHARTMILDAIVTVPHGWDANVSTWNAKEFHWEWRFQDVDTAQAVLPLEISPGGEYRDAWLAARLSEDIDPMAAVATKAFVTGANTWQQEFRCRDRFGRIHTFTQAASIETLTKGHWRVTTINTDISDRVQAEEALRTSEERLATVFNVSPTSICIVRAADNRFVDANPAFLQGSGYTREELIGHTPEELRLWEDADQREAIIREVVENGTASAFKMRGRRKNGEIGIGLGAITRITLNNAAHLLWLVQDITELDRAEEALRESDRRFQQVAENIHEVFWLTDAAKRQLIYVSPAYKCIWGRPTETAYANPASWLEAIRAEDRERVQAALPSQLTGNYDIEYRIVRPDGAVRWIHERAFPVKDSDGKIYRIAGVASDITSRRELEEQFRQAQKMEAVGQLAGGIAHDFNNLLTVIQLQSSLLMDRVKRDREADAGVRQIMEAAKRASHLTRQLLTFSRRQTQTARDLDLSDVIATMTKMLRRILGEDICLESRFTPDLPHVYADPGMMEQVLMNLVVNARDAMPHGGRLMVSLDAVDLDAEYVAAHPNAKAGQYVCLSVSDTGTGIPAEIRNRIFEPFFTTKEVGKGTGLGLATVFGIVEQHHGWLDVESEVGEGSTFRVFLPASTGTAADDESFEDICEIAGGNETILLVEDEAMVRALAGAALRQRGYRVLEADSGPAAMKRWEDVNGAVDLLLTDLIMPGGLSGKDLVEQLSQRSPRLRTLYTTGHSTSAAGKQLNLVAGLNYLEKPYSFSDLAKIVRDCLDAPKR